LNEFKKKQYSFEKEQSKQIHKVIQRDLERIKNKTKERKREEQTNKILGQ
jgi:hypothetical protein